MELRKRDAGLSFTSDDLKSHASPGDCWISERGNVYDVSSFLDQHPGGAEMILRYGGQDVTNVMNDVSSHKHTTNAYSLLSDYKIGVLRGYTECIDGRTTEAKEREYLMEGWREDLVDWDHGMVFQVHKLGEHYMKWVHSPVNRKLRLFDSNFIEYFSKTSWYVIPLVWIPVVIYFAIVAAVTQHHHISKLCMGEKLTIACVVGLLVMSLAGGVLLWTLIEYVLHRFLFHLKPSSSYGITLHFFLHGQHHKVPFDGGRLVFPPAAALPFAVVFYILMTSAGPYGVGYGLFAGQIFGYVIYDLTHYYLHFGAPGRGSYLHSLKYYHVLHHFEDYDSGFGISSKLWDYPFQTLNKKFQ